MTNDKKGGKCIDSLMLLSKLNIDKKRTTKFAIDISEGKWLKRY